MKKLSALFIGASQVPHFPNTIYLCRNEENEKLIMFLFTAHTQKI